MIDYGLLVSMAIAFGVPSVLVTWWPLRSYAEPTGFLDVALGPAIGGLAVGRLTTLALDDPGSIGSLSDMMVVHSGVEFWPGVVAAIAALAWGAHRAGVSPAGRLADIAPPTMVGYACFEAACVFRDGCFGPESSLGIRPPGLTVTMLPVGLLMALAVAGGAVGVRRLALHGARPGIVMSCAVLLVAGTRSIGSVWLPHIGDGPTRQHTTSIVVAIILLVGLGATVAMNRRRGSVDDDVGSRA